MDKKPSSTIIMYDENKRVLLQLRDRKKGIMNPGNWGFFGGSIEKGESKEECIIREVKEELGIDIKSPVFFRTNDYSEIDGVEENVFIKEVNSKITKKFRLSEGRGFAWFYLDEVPRILKGIRREKRLKTFKELGKYFDKK